MKKVMEFFKTNQLAVKWTAQYFAVAFLVFILLFGFNIFSPYDWVRLAHAALHGFSGFVFGVLLLAVLPIYVATTAMIVRTKKPLISFISKPEEKKTEEQKPTEIKAPSIPLPAGIPSELRGAFIRARNNTNAISDFEMKDIGAVTPDVQKPYTEPVGLPLPDNFDFDTEPAKIESGAPVFHEINFENPEPKKEEISIRDGMAIATHDDADFWIADDENWFAAGKQKPSPIAMAIAAATEHNIVPAIYLAEKNIMDLDAKIEEWEKAGVKVLTNAT